MEPGVQVRLAKVLRRPRQELIADRDVLLMQLAVWVWRWWQIGGERRAFSWCERRSVAWEGAFGRVSAAANSRVTHI